MVAHIVAVQAERPSVDAGVHAWLQGSSILDLFGGERKRKHRSNVHSTELAVLADLKPEAKPAKPARRPIMTGEMKTRKDFQLLYPDQWETKWEEAERLEERRYGFDGLPYTWNAWMASTHHDDAWARAKPAPPARIEDGVAGIADDAEDNEAAALEEADKREQEEEQEEAFAQQQRDSPKSKGTGSQEDTQADQEDESGPQKQAGGEGAADKVAEANEQPAKEDADAMLRQDAPPGMDEPIAGSDQWTSCEKKNAHKCGPERRHCCCNVGSTLKKEMKKKKGFFNRVLRKKEEIETCERSTAGDNNPDVRLKQIPGSRARMTFGPCEEKRRNHPCGTGCCCHGLLEWDVAQETCQESPSSKEPSPEDRQIADTSPPQEEPILGSQTWRRGKTLNTCEEREAYPCGASETHCCCRFGCEFDENIDKCTNCREDVPIVTNNMIPSSPLWQKRQKEGICNSRHSHPCGKGCCCNAHFKWDKELRMCKSGSAKLDAKEDKETAKEEKEETDAGQAQAVGSSGGEDSSDDTEEQGNDQGGDKRNFASTRGIWIFWPLVFAKVAGLM